MSHSSAQTLRSEWLASTLILDFSLPLGRLRSTVVDADASWSVLHETSAKQMAFASAQLNSLRSLSIFSVLAFNQKIRTAASALDDVRYLLACPYETASTDEAALASRMHVLLRARLKSLERDFQRAEAMQDSLSTRWKAIFMALAGLAAEGLSWPARLLYPLISSCGSWLNRPMIRL